LTDSLLSIYRTAKRVANDKRFTTVGRQRRVTKLEEELLVLCSVHSLEGSETEGVEDDYRRVVNEVMRLLLAEELFVFVTSEGVDGDNNVSERELRDDAQRRDTGRTNQKTQGRETPIDHRQRSTHVRRMQDALADIVDQHNRLKAALRGTACMAAARVGDFLGPVAAQVAERECAAFGLRVAVGHVSRLEQQLDGVAIPFAASDQAPEPVVEECQRLVRRRCLQPILPRTAVVILGHDDSQDVGHRVQRASVVLR